SNDAWVNFADGLNLRDKPGGNLLSVIPNGQHLTVLGSPNPPDINGNVFQQVQTDNGQTGYVAAIYQGSSLLSTTKPATTTPTTPTTSTTDIWVNSDIGLNFRDVPGGNLIAVLPNGQHLTAIGSSNPPDANGTVFQHVRTNDNQTGYVAAIFQGSSLLSTTKPVATVTVVPWGKCYVGLGMADPRPFNPADKDATKHSKVEAFKILTLGDADETKQLINDLKKIKSDMFIVARLFFSTSAGSKFSAQDFVDYCRVGMEACYQEGIGYFEVHNEPNLPDEGFGGNWVNGAAFGAWLTQVLGLLRVKYPSAKFGYPGLSPQSGNAYDAAAFLNGSASAIALCDWIGVHCYWQTVNGPIYPMSGETDGMYWKRYRTQFPDKLLMITEFSNNIDTVADDEKGRQYARYFQLLRHENNLGAAFSFAVNWPGQDIHREGWVYKGSENRIGSTLGTLIGQAGYLW
ncbi:MAG TPA: SH3 domain-containing protein, partial [Anaerolineae bacterium]|nr:SH3 domain-containing protein [Anaerolineae bacterium]